MTGSHISNVRLGAALAANFTLFSGNEIDHFGDDGIDYGASDLNITKNYIHDNLDIDDGNHPDAMQGVIGVLPAGVAVNNFESIVIDSNTVIRQTDPNLAFPGGLQGIDAFNSNWTYLTVTNNVVITSACWGIAFSSVHGGLIANNTVVNDRLLAASAVCSPAVSVGDKTPGGFSSAGVTVINNLANVISVDNLDPGVAAAHNVGMATAGPVFAWYVSGVAKYYGSPGTYGNANIIAAGGPASRICRLRSVDPDLQREAQGGRAGHRGRHRDRRAGRRHPRGYAHCSLRRRGLFLPGVSSRGLDRNYAVARFAGTAISAARRSKSSGPPA